MARIRSAGCCARKKLKIIAISSAAASVGSPCPRPEYPPSMSSSASLLWLRDKAIRSAFAKVPSLTPAARRIEGKQKARDKKWSSDCIAWASSREAALPSCMTSSIPALDQDESEML
eukprot:scaffold16903_cov31-Tisochrysis_lutea.AAC.3